MRLQLTTLLASAIVTAAAHAQTPRFNLPRDTVLAETKLQIILTGVRPSSVVTIRLEGPNGGQASSATFIADRTGNVDLGNTIPIAGSYAIADAMGLFWSLQRTAAVNNPPARPPAATAATPWQLIAEVGGVVVARDTLWRRIVAPGVRTTRVREPGLSGDYYAPAGTGPHAAVIVLPGSQGGTVQAQGWPGGLASRGYAVLSLAYFNEEGVPPHLTNIPLEYFEHAIQWLRARPEVDPHMPNDSQLSSARSNVSRNTPIRLMPFFLHRLTDTAAVRRAAIPVERIGGPVLLISAREDRLWPSSYMSEQVMARLKERGFKHEYRHLAFENAGHFIWRPYASVIEGPRTSGGAPGDFGGTLEGRARANERAWAEIVAFFDRHLRGLKR